MERESKISTCHICGEPIRDGGGWVGSWWVCGRPECTAKAGMKEDRLNAKPWQFLEKAWETNGPANVMLLIAAFSLYQPENFAEYQARVADLLLEINNEAAKTCEYIAARSQGRDIYWHELLREFKEREK